MAPGPGGAATGGVAVSVHGPLGVLDLVVPSGASSGDLAREYAEQSGLGTVPLMYTRIGEPLLADVALADAGIESGDVLVAATSVHRARVAAREPLVVRSSAAPGPLAALWFAVAATVAALAGWVTAYADGTPRSAALALLVLGAAVGVAPVGRYAAHRTLAAPAFAASAAFALSYDPHPERLPVVVGIAALAGGVCAAVARSLGEHVEEGLRVWVVAGAGVFLVATGTALAGLPASVTWSLLLVLAMLAARFVPAFAVDVPDQLLLDLERLAVTAWSARERPRGRRGRVVASMPGVAAVARRGARMVGAAAVAIAVVAVVSAGLLLEAVTFDLDRTGARVLVVCAGAALLLAGRSYRHSVVRALLRCAGLGCWVLVADDVLRAAGAGLPAALAAVAIPLAVALLAAAVATGRGWRSVWWARRAEVAEGLAGASALASVLVATGLFRLVWELGSRIAP